MSKIVKSILSRKLVCIVKLNLRNLYLLFQTYLNSRTRVNLGVPRQEKFGDLRIESKGTYT
jgi:hypothetical protein